MSAFSSLSPVWQTVIPILLFFDAVLELGLFLYQILRSSKPRRSLYCALNFTVLLILLFSVTQGDPDHGKDAFLIGAPWFLFAATVLLSGIHFAVAFPREYRRRRNELSPSSIKEATDKLPMGICFADPDGRIILCNNRMRRLSFALCGHELQIAEDYKAALENPDEAVTVKDGCYILPDGTVWQFDTQYINVDNDNCWQQMTAHNVTELYNGNLRQAEINRELKEVNRKLQKMYERMADDIKEKESLDLKIHIHDTIGRSLLTIRDIIDSSADSADTERKIDTLQEAVRVLTSDHTVSHGTMDALKDTAKKLGVTVRTEGYLPFDTVVEELTVAAGRECVTNCVKHAGGDEVQIRIAERNDLYDITITNSGTPPTDKIREGSGLTSLRNRIEAAGGEMHTAYKPRFALLITLPRKENDL